MNLEKNNSNDLDNLYQDYWAFHAKMIDQDNDPLEIAAILMAQAMSIYKTLLSNDEYQSMIDSVSDARDKVQRLEPELGSYH
jgi:hypothetical protein